jgi:DNA-binding transcriptional LysR family regulator
MDIELRHLRAFVAVAEERSFTYAAAGLHITQPALSRTIRQLEEALRVKLIARTSRSFDLTREGREFHDRARRILADLDEAVRGARGSAVFRLGFSWLLPSPWAQQAAARFTEVSGMVVSFVRVDHPAAALRRGEVDAVLIRSGQPGGDIDSVRLFDEPRVAACSRHSPLAAYPELHWDEVPRWPLVINTANGTTQAGLWPDAAPPRIIETTNYDEWIESVAAGAGIGIVPDIAEHRNTHPELRFVPLVGAPPVTVRLAIGEALPRAIRDGFLRAARPQ